MENISFDEMGTPAKGPDTSQPLRERNAQLRARIESRMEELEKTLAGMDEVSDRCRSLKSSLEQARSYLRAGWDGMSEAEATQLSSWVKTTEDLIVTSPGMPAIKRA